MTTPDLSNLTDEDDEAYAQRMIEIHKRGIRAIPRSAWDFSGVAERLYAAGIDPWTWGPIERSTEPEFPN
jgi:hypothetical protein